MQIYRVLRESLPSLALPNLHEEISEDVMKELGRLHQLADATELALSFVSKSTLSRQKLYEKLRRKNIPQDEAKEAVRMVVGYGYLREQEQIKMLILRYVEEGKGPALVQAKLASLGYRPKDIHEAEQSLTAQGLLDFAEAQRQRQEEMREAGVDELGIMKKLRQLGYVTDEEC